MAEGINKVILIGNLGKDPKLEYSQNGAARCTFSLATTENYMNNSGERQERVEWHNIVVWGKQAENVSKYLQKGRQVYIEGRIQTRSYDDKDGNKRYITEINALRVLFIGNRGESGGGGYPNSNSSGNGGQSSGGGYDGGFGGGGFGGGMGPSDDEIPF